MTTTLPDNSDKVKPAYMFRVNKNFAHTPMTPYKLVASRSTSYKKCGPSGGGVYYTHPRPLPARREG